MVRVAIIACLLGLPTLSHAQFLGKSVSEWAKDLNRGDESKRRNAAFALGKLGPPSLDSVSHLKNAVLYDSSPRVREAAIFALGELALHQDAMREDGDIPGVLVKALGDADPLVRRSGAYAVGCFGRDASFLRPNIERALNDARPEVRQNAAWTLGRLGNDAAPSLRRALADSDALVLRDAAQAMGRLDAKVYRDAVLDLAKLAGHTDVEVRKAALFALVPIVRPTDAKTPAITSVLGRGLRDSDSDVRQNAAFALSNIGGPSAVPAIDVLIEAMREGNLELKRQAAVAFGNIGPPAQRAVPELIAALRSSDPNLRASAAMALGGIGDPSAPAVRPLAGLIANRSEPAEVRAHAAVALSLIGPTKEARAIVPDLLAVLANPDDDGKVRERVMWALRVHNVELRVIPGVREAFLKVLKERLTTDNRMVRQDCAYIASLIFGPKAPPEVFPVLLEYLKDESVQVYRSTATQVGGAQETSAGKTSSLEVGDGDGRQLAIDALRALGPASVRSQPAILEQLRRLADSNQTLPAFRQQCRDLLRSVGG